MKTENHNRHSGSEYFFGAVCTTTGRLFHCGTVRAGSFDDAVTKAKRAAAEKMLENINVQISEAGITTALERIDLTAVSIQTPMTKIDIGHAVAEFLEGAAR
jgi:hypothetical protein